MSNRTTVLVTNGSTYNALAAVRSLGRAGYRVWVIDRDEKKRRFGEAFFSKFCAGRGWYSDPRSSKKDFVKDLLELIARSKADILLPIGIDTTSIIVSEQNQFRPRVALALPTYDVFEKAHDKEKTLEIAKDIDVPIPKSICVKNFSHIGAVASEWKFPAVLKKRKSSGSEGVWIVNSQTELEKTYRVNIDPPENCLQEDIIFSNKNPLLQDYIPGDVHDVCVLADQGRLITAMTQIRLNLHGSKFGSGIHNQTTYEPELIKYSERLVNALNWHGVAQIEYKWDTRDNIPKLIEMNPKFWGTLALAIEAGINFPHLACQLALEKEIDHKNHYDIGVLYSWFFPYKIESFINATGKKRILSEIMKSTISGRGGTDCRLSDPLPLAPQIARAIYGFIKTL